jgi:hypothetical protein
MEELLPVLATYRDRGLPDDGWLPTRHSDGATKRTGWRARTVAGWVK